MHAPTGSRRSRSILLAATVLVLSTTVTVGGDLGLAESGADAEASQVAARLLATAVRGNGLVAFTTKRDGNNEIYSMFFDGFSQINLTKHSGHDKDPAWSPAGDKIAFTSNRSGNYEIWVMDPDGSSPVKLTSEPGSDSQPTWSADGLKIAFTSDRSGTPDIWTMNADGTGPKRLTKIDGSETDPAWSPNNQKVAFTSDKAGSNDVWTIKTNGRGYKNLTNDPATDSQPAWSPDGRQIAFTTNRTNDFEVFVMNSDGTGLANRTNTPENVDDYDPVWSPDQGSKIMFTSDRTRDLEVFYMRSFDGANPAPVTVDYENDDSQPSWQPLIPYEPLGTPIQHVVFLVQENHSFDNVFGVMCVEDDRCDGVMQGELNDGTIIDLPRGGDFVAKSPHSYNAHLIAINGGQMNGFDVTSPEDCGGPNYRCHEQYYPDQIPALTELARTFAISDRTFETDGTGSYGTHFTLAATHLDGFYTATHHEAEGQDGFGVGCDSGNVGLWYQNWVETNKTQPTCVPTLEGEGPFRDDSKVHWTPSIMDRLAQQGVPWKIYGAGHPGDGVGYGWSICPTFANCLINPEMHQHFIDRSNFFVDAANGDLPAFSFLIPDNEPSQHNSRSMLLGDNWIGDVATAVMNGPDWNSTALFITYDDAGIFYDHVPPPASMTGAYYTGIRMPMVIVSPWAKPAYTDSNIATWASVLAFTEKNYGLAPLSDIDYKSYDYMEAFDFTQQPIAPITLNPTPVPAHVIRWMLAHPDDPNDPT